MVAFEFKWRPFSSIMAFKTRFIAFSFQERVYSFYRDHLHFPRTGRHPLAYPIHHFHPPNRTKRGQAYD